MPTTSSPQQIPPLPKLFSSDGDSFSDENRVTVTVQRLIALAGAQLVAEKLKAESKSSSQLQEILAAQTKLIEDFLQNPPRSVWLGTQTEVADAVSLLGVAAGSYPDERLCEIILGLGVQMLKLSAPDERSKQTK